MFITVLPMLTATAVRPAPFRYGENGPRRTPQMVTLTCIRGVWQTDQQGGGLGDMGSERSQSVIVESSVVDGGIWPIAMGFGKSPDTVSGHWPR